MVEQINIAQLDTFFDDIAQILGLSRETLPIRFAPSQEPVSRKPQWQVALEDVELSADEVEIIKRCLPHGTPRRSRDDAQFVNACLAHQRLQTLGKSWWYLDPVKFGPTSSNAGRSARWDQRGWWRVFFENLVEFGGLSELRLSEFAALAAAADKRRCGAKRQQVID